MTAELGQNPDALLRDAVRKEQIEYRKWIVTLATFVLTVSLGLIGHLAKPFHYKGLLVVGWILLGFCIFFNWLLIKRFVEISLAVPASHDEPGLGNLLPTLASLNIQFYARAQNLAFLGGVLAVGLGFVLNV
jgi:MFS family permease